jgi:hypothetical protein
MTPLSTISTARRTAWVISSLIAKPTYKKKKRRREVFLSVTTVVSDSHLDSDPHLFGSFLWISRVAIIQIFNNELGFTENLSPSL